MFGLKKNTSAKTKQPKQSKPKVKTGHILIALGYVFSLEYPIIQIANTPENLSAAIEFVHSIDGYPSVYFMTDDKKQIVMLYENDDTLFTPFELMKFVNSNDIIANYETSFVGRYSFQRSITG